MAYINGRERQQTDRQTDRQRQTEDRERESEREKGETLIVMYIGWVMWSVLRIPNPAHSLIKDLLT